MMIFFPMKQNVLQRDSVERIMIIFSMKQKVLRDSIERINLNWNLWDFIDFRKISK